MLAGVAGVVGALFLWAFAVEPYSVELTAHAIAADVAAPLRIAHITDLHTQGMGRRERRVVELVALAKPDLIVVTGDTVTLGGTPAGYRAVWKALVDLEAPLGVVAVRGNWEYDGAPGGRRAGSASEAEAEALGVVTLVNASRGVRDDLWAVGLDDPLAGQASVADAVRGLPAGVFRLGLVHSPQWMEDFAPAVDLVLAGHTHGGQVRMPLFGPLWLAPGTGKYVAGWYEVGGTDVYVNRGIGTSIAPVRFNCRPEVAIIELQPR